MAQQAAVEWTIEDENERNILLELQSSRTRPFMQHEWDRLHELSKKLYQSYFISKKETTQTAIDWLIEQFEKNGYIGLQAEKQAKAMERQQIVDAFYEGMQANTFDPNKGRALMYYNETYNK